MSVYEEGNRTLCIAILSVDLRQASTISHKLWFGKVIGFGVAFLRYIYEDLVTDPVTDDVITRRI